MITRPMFTELYAPGLNKVFFESYTYFDSEYDKYLNVLSSDVSYVEDYKMAGFGGVPTKAEGASIIYDDLTPGSKIQYTWTAYGKGAMITHEAMVDDRYGQMKKIAQSMGRAFRNKVESVAIGVLNSGFGTAGGFSSEYLFLATHALLRSASTVSNLGSTDITATAIANATIAMEKTLDDSGVPVLCRPKLVIVDPSEMVNAQVALRSAFLPGGQNNDINVVAGMGLQLMVSHYISDPDTWFLLADNHDLNFFWREKTTTDSADDFDTGNGKFKAYMRFGVGYGDWRGTWGSPGA